MPKITSCITKISRCSHHFHNACLGETGLRSAHGSYLWHVCHTPGITQEQLAQKTCIDKSNITRQTAFLEERGLIRRECSPTDRRAMLLYPTEKALALLPRLEETDRNWSALITQDLTEEENEVLCRCLDKMRLRAVQWLEERKNV